MQAYTHLVVGALVGKVVFPQSLVGQIACVICSVIPDVVMVPKFLIDKLAGRTPLESQSPRLIRLKRGSHSLVFWIFVGMLSILFSWQVAKIALIGFSVGGVSHVILDILSHRDNERPGCEVTYMWPLPGNLHGLAIYEYRIGSGDLRAKPPEITLIIITILLYITLWVV